MDLLDMIFGNIAVVIGVIVAVLVLVIVVTGYVKASPDTAYIISGLRKEPKVLIGKAGIKIPFLEKKDELNLQLIPIDVKTSNAWFQQLTILILMLMQQLILKSVMSHHV